MFEQLTPKAPDAIIAMMEQAKADPNPDKIDLGVGVYKTADGETPIMRAVAKAQARLMEAEETKTYVGTVGLPAFRAAMLELIFGDDHPAVVEGRIASSQAAGGSGALRLGAELIALAVREGGAPDATVWVSTPTWANHTPLIGSVGFDMQGYPYYDRESLSVRFDDMVAHLKAHAKSGDVILLHGSCHNPTGADLSPEQWDVLAPLMAERGWLPFVDLAYLGLGDGIDADAYGLRACVAACPEVVLAASCSKNFGLYRERVGLAAVILADKALVKTAQTQFGAIQRKLISMPPNWGAELVATILGDRELRHDWVSELNDMRTRIKRLRRALADELNVQGGEAIADAVLHQTGMFSTLPLSAEQATRLRDESSVYLTNSGRVNIAGASLDNIPRLAERLLAVM